MLKFAPSVIEAVDGFLDAEPDSTIDSAKIKSLKKFFTSNDGGPLFKFRARHMEKRAKAYLATKGITVTDWASANIDWKALLNFLIAILPLILLLFP